MGKLSGTYTYAILEVSPATFAEITNAFLEAGYNDNFHKDGDKLVIDMHGVALMRKDDSMPATTESTEAVQDGGNTSG